MSYIFSFYSLPDSHVLKAMVHLLQFDCWHFYFSSLQDVDVEDALLSESSHFPHSLSSFQISSLKAMHIGIELLIEEPCMVVLVWVQARRIH